MTLTFRDVTLGYDRHPAVHHLSGNLRRGSLTALVGPNGAGKSTFFRGIVGFLQPLSGKIERMVDRRDIAYLPQVTEIDRSFPVNVFDFAAAGLWSKIGALRGIDAASRTQIETALDALGLLGFERKPIGTLSGGQMQRLLFSRLILQDAHLIVLDEPFNAIDERTTADLVARIHAWHDEGRTVIAALHDLSLVRAHFPETLLLARRTIAWGPTETSLTEANLAAARRMSEAFDDHADACAHTTPSAA
ncbi:glutaredoxin [Platysternon megacephalum]|uniref:Glutaredoxin n=1 Tax=Platysternon megacephalum TaxID=55544 RepID=A0A4D9DED5_9SAUR|nr:glutaredoxin [Platysternon megacephalum]